jgi:post-segregation antitoxin (ccd killing protein)
MNAKVKVNLTMDHNVVRKAKKMGLNLSQFCENCLREAIEALEQRKQPTETNGGLVDARSASLSARWCGRRDSNPGSRLGKPKS